jgi:hypothetical protein
MKRLTVVIFAVLMCLAVGAFAQGPGNLNAGSRLAYTGSTGAYTFSWWGVAGNTYLIETSDDLINWSYLPIVETGSNATIQWGFTSNASNLFMKLEYIAGPPGQLTGTVFNGPVDSNSGLPGDWELFYFGQLGVNPNAYVPWSGGTITNLQAYQQGLNPTDFYKGTAPTLTAITDTELPAETGSSATIRVQVTGSSNNPMPGAPVIFSIDYGLLSVPGGSGVTQEVEVAADSNGYASVTALEPLWPGVAYTVTAKAETAGHITSIPFTGETGDDDPTIPPVPPLTFPNPNNVSEPALSVELSSTSVANPAFEQFNPPTSGTTDWYLVETQSNSGTVNPVNEGSDGLVVTYTGTYNSVETVTPLFGGTSWVGSSEESGTETDSGTPVQYWYSYADQSSDGSTWSGETYTDGTYTGDVNEPIWALSSADLISQSATEQVFSISNSELTTSGQILLSNEYTTQQFQSDVISAVPSTATWDDSDYAVGDTLGWNELADDVSSYSIGTSSYKFKCATTGTAPYVFEWYEVFQPDDDTQPIQVTHQEWDSANQQSESSVYRVGPSASGSNGTNGTWYIARLDMQTLAQYPACQWRHVIGIGEDVRFNLVGLPTSLSGSATWSITPSTSGSFNSPSLIGAAKTFIAARTAGNVTITVTLPGGATMLTTLSILAPSGITYTKIASISLPWWGVGAGMWGQYTLLPTNVSFSGCVYQEEKCPSTSPTGFYSITGMIIWHNPTGQSDTSEPPDINPVWIPIQDDNTSAALDRAEAGPANIATATAMEALGPPSGFIWIIPLRYKCQNDTDNGVLLPVTVTTQMQIDQDSFVIKGDAVESNGP